MNFDLFNHLDICQKVQEAGATAIFWKALRTGEPGREMYDRNGRSSEHVSIPIYSVEQNSYEELLLFMEEKSYVYGNIEASTTTNTWKNLADSILSWTCQMIMGTASVCMVALCGYVLYTINRVGFSFNIACISVIIVCVGSIIDLTYIFVDPLGLRNLLPWSYWQITFTIHFNFPVLLHYLVIFYLWEALHQSKLSKNAKFFLKRLQLPYFISVIAFLSVSFAMVILRILDISTSLNNLARILPFLIGIITGWMALGLFIYLYIKITMFLKKRKRSSKKLSYLKRTISVNIVLIFIGNISSVVYTLILLNSAYGYFIGYTVNYVIILVTLVYQVFQFKVSKEIMRKKNTNIES
eukprot:TRINITY_DN2850_c0_g1_i3.p1 TRINITY_DN2850_c0_g1~~TRINITY_DN2850_c0_g1_i3.p1  ORF type:complete len:354 (-),score=38.56 TRINITY_DN2850_c0_g1_i3:52-1113(-)